MTEYACSMFPGASHDEASHQDFIRSFMSRPYAEIMPSNRVLYDNKGVPRYLEE